MQILNNEIDSIVYTNLLGFDVLTDIGWIDISAACTADLRMDGADAAAPGSIPANNLRVII